MHATTGKDRGKVESAGASHPGNQEVDIDSAPAMGKEREAQVFVLSAMHSVH